MLAGATLFGRQSATFTGILVDASGARIAAIPVFLVATDSTQIVAVLSGPDGAFSISSAPAREYVLQIVTAGFKINRVKLPKAEPGQIINIGNIAMEVAPTWMDFPYGDFAAPVPEMHFPLTDPLDDDDMDSGLCKLEKDPARFLRIQVRLRTQIAGPGLDTDQLLFDKNCQLPFGPAAPAVTHDWTYRMMMGYLNEQHSAKATLRGKLDYQLRTGSDPIYYFLIEEVSDLTKGPPNTIVFPRPKK
jgi:hypothetical protein